MMILDSSNDPAEALAPLAVQGRPCQSSFVSRLWRTLEQQYLCSLYIVMSRPFDGFGDRPWPQNYPLTGESVVVDGFARCIV